MGPDKLRQWRNDGFRQSALDGRRLEQCHEVSTTCGSGWVCLQPLTPEPTRYRKWY